MRLVIVESPAKCKKIKGFLGDGWDVQACFGHIRDLPQKELGVDLDTFTPRYEITKGNVVKTLKAKAKAATEIWLATDLDREGEAIAWHLQQVLGSKAQKRIVFGEITQSAIRAAIAAPRQIDTHRVEAQEGRRITDRLVGYRVSPVVSQLASERMSAGRVQSVVVKLVAERDAAIAFFAVTTHYSVLLNFGDDNPPWKAELDTKPFTCEEDPYITDLKIIERIAETAMVKVIKSETKPRVVKAPGAFMTDTLQQAASVKLGMSVTDTMTAAQKLYEEGLITYHRTDFPNLADEGREAAYQQLRELGFTDDIPATPNVEKVPDGSQEAHEAIRPTNYKNDVAGLSKNERDLYNMIVERTLASQMCAAEYEQTKVVLEAFNVSVDDVFPQFTASGQRLVRAGWKGFSPTDATNEEQEEEFRPLPPIEAGVGLMNFTTEIIEKKTKAPAKFTEASIIKFLKKMEIGRPSTWASIIKNITERGYIQFNKRAISITEKGKRLVSLLQDCDFMDYGYTQQMEAQLDAVAAGKIKYQTLVGKLNTDLTANLAVLNKKEVKISNPCPLCGKQVNRINGKNGWFWACSGYRDGCKFTAYDRNGEMLTPEQAAARKERAAKDTTQTEYPCTCGQGHLIRRPSKKKGAKGKTLFWYGCSRYPDCTNTFFEADGKPEVKPTEKGA